MGKIDFQENSSPSIDFQEENAASPQVGLGEKIGRSITGALPTAGMLTGGILGSSAGPVGTVGAAGLGWAGGKEAETLANHYLFGDALQSDNPVDQAKRVAGNTLTGAAYDAGGQIAGKVLSPVGQYISNKLGSTAEDFATTHLRPTAKMYRDLGPQGVRAAAREALDSGAIKPFAKVDTTAANLDNLMNEVGAVKGDIVNSSDASINPSDVASAVRDQVINPLRQTAETQPIADTIENKIGLFEKQYPGDSMTPSQLEAEKTAVQNNINYGTNSSAQNDASQGYARILKQKAEDAINDPTFQRSKQAFGNIANASTMADRTAGLIEGGTGLLGKIQDTGFTVPAVLNPNPLTIGMKAAQMAGRGRTASTAAYFTNKLASLVQTNPEALGEFAPALKSAAAAGSDRLAITNFILGQNSPIYRLRVERLLNQDSSQ